MLSTSRDEQSKLNQKSTTFSDNDNSSITAASPTSIGVEFDSVSVLETVGPGSFVSGDGGVAEPDAVSPLEAVRPFAAVNPSTFGFYAQSVPLPAHPLAFVIVAARPRVHALHLETVGPLTRVLPLALGTRADAVTVSFSILPIAAIRATIVEVETTAACQRREVGGKRGRWSQIAP